MISFKIFNILTLVQLVVLIKYCGGLDCRIEIDFGRMPSPVNLWFSRESTNQISEPLKLTSNM